MTTRQELELQAKALYNTGFVDGQNCAENETQDTAFVGRTADALEHLLERKVREARIDELNGMLYHLRLTGDWNPETVKKRIKELKDNDNNLS